MPRILTVIHLCCALLLLAAHALFFSRGLAIEAGRFKPARMDRLARSLSQLLLPLTALSGLVWRLSSGGAEGRQHSLLHLILGFSPMAAIPLIYFARVLLKKRRQAPWLLPALNLVLLCAATITGILAWR